MKNIMTKLINIIVVALAATTLSAGAKDEYPTRIAAGSITGMVVSDKCGDALQKCYATVRSHSTAPPPSVDEMDRCGRKHTMCIVDEHGAKGRR